MNLDLKRSVTEVVYQADHKPNLDKPVLFSGLRRCGNCLSERPCAQAARVLSVNFGSWDDIVINADGSRWLCLPCSYAYRSADYRRQITLVCRTTMSAHRPTHVEVQALLAHAIPVDIALVVPVGGKRVVLPRARWGQIACDSHVHTWTRRNSHLLQVGAQLLALGVPKGLLGKSSPPFDLLRDSPDGERLLALWREFAPARNDKILQPLYLRLLGTERERTMQ